ncbi:alpha/beta hydrolase [Enterovirga rhinocerotis]|uniref:Palmitoyl-protein thioesterase ABHD10, mitochondrial n=1 Tax=Enterovirga rhinocerotis TaxID=1339210 RepID=A0A4R7CAJ1_9HYPH|nr:alpha/beta hydrolase [Enterovirga rhinocerotis]TDR94026.1 pimeloyl-ACP methyl ester carboxylesterase [Enterovirga rhinocerotis]
MASEITVGEGEAGRRIAVESREGAEPAVVWFGGFRSDMTGTKAEALDSWAAETGRAFVRFDYSGHGASGGRFEDGTISRWLEEGLAVLDARTTGRPILVGSSMGGWIALLANRALRRTRPDRAPAALVLIAPAADFTERLMWDAFPPEARASLMETGVYLRPSLYSEDGYPITRGLIEDGRNHLLLDGTIETGCPVHILQGMDDPDVPWEHAMRLVEHLPGEAVQITLVKDGDHRLSRPEDIERLVAAVAAAGRPPQPVEAPGPQLRLTV